MAPTQNWLRPKTVFGQAVKLVFTHWKIILSCLVILVLLSLGLDAVLNYLITNPSSTLTLGQLTAIRNTFYGIILLYQFGVLIILIRLLQNPETKALRLLTKGAFWKHAVFGLLVWLLTVVLIGFASFLLIIPGVILSVVFSLALYVLIFEDVNIFDAFKRSLLLTKGYRWQVFSRLLFLLTVSVLLAFLSIVPITGPMVAGVLSVFLSYVVIFYMGLTYQEIVRLKVAGKRSQSMSTGRKVWLIVLATLLFSSLALFSSVSTFVGEVTATAAAIQAQS